MSIKRLLHWGPLLAISISLFIFLTTIISISMWLPSNKSLIGFINFMVYCLQLGLMLYNFFNSIFQGPGFAPFGWKPDDKKIKKLKEIEINDLRMCLQYCDLCKGYKPPRAHHCRKCERCVLKMDHHCPWINTCCGHRNHAYFIYFLLFAVTGSIHSLILSSITLYRAYHAVWYFYNSDRTTMVYLSFKFFIFIFLSIGFSIGVILGVGCLLYMQMKIVLKNMTSIEEWIMTKANARTNNQFIYPYDLGSLNNLKDLFINNSSNGIDWKLRDGCHEYSLTAEQVQQKLLKRENTKYFVALEDYNGRWFPLFSQGFWTCINFPFTDEPRIKFNKSDVIKVTRSKKYWLYGEKEADKKKNTNNKITSKNNRSIDNLRGWFPRQCVVEMIFTEDQLVEDNKKNK